jgi:hypothetical protein
MAAATAQPKPTDYAQLPSPPGNMTVEGGFDGALGGFNSQQLNREDTKTRRLKTSNASHFTKVGRFLALSSRLGAFVVHIQFCILRSRPPKHDCGNLIVRELTQGSKDSEALRFLGD